MKRQQRVPGGHNDIAHARYLVYLTAVLKLDRTSDGLFTGPIGDDARNVRPGKYLEVTARESWQKVCLDK